MSTTYTKPKILIAPLNWGLGHATRCMPIINEFLAANLEVLIASDGAALQLLQKEYPQLTAFELPSYNIRYRSTNMALNMIGQLPKILNAIRKERSSIAQIVAAQKINVIVSDNRFGCWHPDCYNVFLTHQLNIKAPFKFIEKIIAILNHKKIAAFNECWVPDYETAPHLSGDLGHPALIPNVKYVGALSRLKASSENSIKYEILAILSGPEPQRSYLEEKILYQMEEIGLPGLLVRGRMDDQERTKINDNLEVVGHLTATEINQAMAQSKYIIARSGYSTIMDLAVLKKPALLVPTPGQTEQEYLARRFHKKGIFLYQEQGSVDLKKALTQLPRFSGITPTDENQSTLKAAIRQLPIYC